MMIEIWQNRHDKLCVYWSDYKSNRYLHIRYMYKDQATGEYKPGVKGLAMPEAVVASFVMGLKQLLEQGNVEQGSGDVPS